MNEPTLSARRKWLEVFGRQRSSGLSVAAFCREYRIATSSFFAWKRKIGSGPAAPVFIEAKVAGAAPVVRPGVRSTGVIEVRLRGGRRVRVGGGLDSALLAQIVTVLEGLS